MWPCGYEPGLTMPVVSSCPTNRPIVTETSLLKVSCSCSPGKRQSSKGRRQRCARVSTLPPTSGFFRGESRTLQGHELDRIQTTLIEWHVLINQAASVECGRVGTPRSVQVSECASACKIETGTPSRRSMVRAKHIGEPSFSSPLREWSRLLQIFPN